MRYAVIKTGGKQYRVAEGDVLDVDKVPEPNGEKISFDDVLLLVSDDKVKVGKPKLTGVSVVGKVLEQHKGEKVRIAKFKAKARYRRVMGFRAQLTRVQIEKILSD